MNQRTVILSVLVIVVLLAGIPESFARSEYLPSLTAVYGDSSCGTCHVKPSGGGPRNSYGTLFENQANHAADPAAALKAIGQPPGAAATPAVTNVTATVTPKASGFGIVFSLVGLFVCFLLVKKK